MLNRVIADYGAPSGGYVNGEAVESPSDEVDAEYFNTLLDDSASMTRTSTRIFLQFKTTTTAGPVALTPDADWFIETHWGTASGASSTLYPTTAQKTSAGVYTFTWAQTFENEYNDDETLTVKGGWGQLNSATDFQRPQIAVTAANTITVTLLDDTHTADEPSNGTKVQIWLR